MLIKSNNFVPVEIILRNKHRKRLSMLSKGLRVIIAVCIFALACEASFFFVASEMKVPPALEAEHAQAVKEIAGIKNELSTIELAKKEEQYPLTALRGLLINKPNELRFMKVDIGQGDVTKLNTDWVRVEVISNNPLAINEFASRLGQDAETFQNAAINRITTNASTNMKVADIIAGKK